MIVGVFVLMDDCFISFLGGDGVFRGVRLTGDMLEEVECPEGETGCFRLDTTSEKSRDGIGGDPQTEVEAEGCGVGGGTGGVFWQVGVVWVPGTPCLFGRWCFWVPMSSYDLSVANDFGFL